MVAHSNSRVRQHGKMRSVTKRSAGKLNLLERTLPEGMLVDAAWMEAHGYSSSLRSQYVTAGWLEKPTRGTFKRPQGKLTWESVVASLQHLMNYDVHVGGRTSLELHGFGHYFQFAGPKRVELYTDAPLPGWLGKLPFEQTFRAHRVRTLFRPMVMNVRTTEPLEADVPYPLIVATRERAWIEMLAAVPRQESFHHADKIGESLHTLGPRRMQTLLEACKSVKAKRLTLWFADRHGHPWLARIERDRIDTGSGKRMLVRGGRLDPTYLITVPKDLDAAS